MLVQCTRTTVQNVSLVYRICGSLAHALSRGACVRVCGAQMAIGLNW